MAAKKVAEPQYGTAKTSVWWDIENCGVPRDCDGNAIAQNISSALANLNYNGPISISAYGDTNQINSSVQQALSSTGIALHHVPSGIKDASDKKILVDMFLWAVDNPAPANYLLISGDRDFSNALHQLRMRRYNILLAQPQRASAPLVAAARSVWLWTSLLAGGLPLSDGESLPLGNHSSTSSSETSQIPVSDSTQTMDSIIQKLNLGIQSDTKQKGKGTLKTLSETNGAEASNVPLRSQEYQQSLNSSQPGPSVPQVPFSGPSPGFIPGNSNFTWSDVINVHGNDRNHSPPICPSAPGMQPDFAASSFYPPNLQDHAPLLPMPTRPNVTSFTSVPSLTSVPDIGSLNISGCPTYFLHHPPNAQRQSGEQKHDQKKKVPKPINSKNTKKGYKSQDMPSGSYKKPMNGRPGGPEDVPGHAGVILLALETLRSEMVMPTEANIADCIRYGNPKHCNINIKKALNKAIKKNIIVIQQSGLVQLYIGKRENVWKSVNPVAGDPDQYPEATWDEIQKFLASPAGRSAILSSRCRYEAAKILKRMCLKQLALGNNLQILNMAIDIKKWIIHHESGWQPLIISIAENNVDSGLAKHIPKAVQDLIRVILLALNTLKSEKIMPTEAIITDYIHYKYPEHHNADIKKVLDTASEQNIVRAVDQKMVVNRRSKIVRLYVGKRENVWKSINPVGGDPDQYPEATWVDIWKFLASPAGRSAILSSRCRYEAATILKSMCLKELALGNILQLLNMTVAIKKWITHHKSGWQPLIVTVAEEGTDSVLATGIPEYAEGLAGVILRALNTLKTEKIMPTEANIADCIQYGDTQHCSTDIKKALDSAIEQQMVVKQNLGFVQFYVGKNETLWECVSTMVGSPEEYPKETWDKIHKFLASGAGRSAILSSRCRYEAATMLKHMCLKELALGNILQLLYMSIAIKKWVMHHESGWQPLIVTVAEDDTDCGLATGIPEDVQGLAGVILHALHTLKSEKIMPTEAGIADCIKYGDPKHCNTDIKNALDTAIERQILVKQNLGFVQYYVGKNEKLWEYVNIIGSNPEDYPKATWDEIHKFLASPTGRSAILSSQCRYEAASMLKNMCLQELALGNVMQLLNMASAEKKWIIHRDSGWQPLIITVAEDDTSELATGSFIQRQYQNVVGSLWKMTPGWLPRRTTDNS